MRPVRLRDERAESRVGLGIDRERARARELEPVGLRVAPAARACRRRPAQPRAPRTRASDGRHALTPLLERRALLRPPASSMLWSIVRARFATDLFLARDATMSSVLAHVAGSATAAVDALERRKTGVLVFGLEGDVEELGRIRQRGRRPPAPSARQAACRATLLSVRTSVTRPSAAARTVS